MERRRAEAAETFLWRHAAGGVVTTETQANSLHALLPDLKLLVRPNGYFTAAEPKVDGEPASAEASELRLVQFGSVNSARLPIGDWLSRLRTAAGLTRVRFANYGHVDRPELLRSRDPAVVVETHAPVDWGRACQIARAFDAALVVANRNPAQLPSKAVQYLTLPIQRIALTASSDRGELGAFASQRPAFIAVGVDSPEDIPRLMGHLRREWSDEELRPPAADSWPQVGRQVVGSQSSVGTAQGRPSVGMPTVSVSEPLLDRQISGAWLDELAGEPQWLGRSHDPQGAASPALEALTVLQVPALDDVLEPGRA